MRTQIVTKLPWTFLIVNVLLLLLLCSGGCVLFDALVRAPVETDARGEALRDAATGLGTMATGSRWIGELIGGIVLAGAGVAGLVKYKKKKSVLEQAVGHLVGSIEDNCVGGNIKAVKLRMASLKHPEIEKAVKKLNNRS